jgi:hypothetical protein
VKIESQSWISSSRLELALKKEAMTKVRGKEIKKEEKKN